MGTGLGEHIFGGDKMRRPMIAGNWKMFFHPAEAEKLILELKPLVKNGEVDVVVCPPFVDLPAVLKAAEGSNIMVGAQNMFWAEQGAFTGEISPLMLKAMEVDFVIIGHSERRQLFGETDEAVQKKVQAAFLHQIKPIVCVGETLEQREKGKTRAVVEGQVMTGLAGLLPNQAENLIIAYEPVWAIGTGKNASAEDAETVISQIRSVFAAMYGEQAGNRVRILYGGSVKPENIKEFMIKPNIDGALVGGASLKSDSFSRIVGF